MVRDKPLTVDLADEELAKVSGGSNALIDAFTQGFQKGLTEGAPPEGQTKALNTFERVLNKVSAA